MRMNRGHKGVNLSLLYSFTCWFYSHAFEGAPVSLFVLLCRGGFEPLKLYINAWELFVNVLELFLKTFGTIY